MNIIMSGLDFNSASIDVREKFSVLQGQTGALAKQIQIENNLSGCVIISTCNRTEIYISHSENAIKPSLLLQKALGYAKDEYGFFFTSRVGDNAIQHLMETSAGLNSQIFGDDQIVSQVKSALATAHEANSADPVLAALFRNAIAAAKRVKTEVRLGALSPSVATMAIDYTEKHFGSLNGINALVIGNGEMGRLASACLIQKGANVTVTIREYKYKPIMVPDGCTTIAYSSRYENFSDYELVVSATTSPHYTITFQEIQNMKEYPVFYMDLALPRDIDPDIERFNITLCNVDSLKGFEAKTGLKEALTIIEKYKQKYYDWYNYRLKINNSATAAFD